MKLTAVKSTICGLLLLGSVANVSAQSADAINVVTTAVPFLRISPDARAGGMGEVGIATSPDANSSFWNIGKVAFNESKAGAGITYTPWLKDLGLNDVYLLSAAGYAKLDDLSAISGSVRYFSLGNIQFTDNLGNDLSTFRPREFGVDFGYSRKLSDKMGVGVGLKFISSNLASGSVGGNTYKTGTTVAGDLGFYYNIANDLGQGWTFGATMTNLGGKIGYTDNATQKDYIPANLGLGTTYTRVFDEQNKLSFGLDINKLMVPTPPADPATQTQIDKYRSKGVLGSWFSSFGDAPGGFGEEIKEFQASLGAEYTYNNQFSLRAGYFNESKTKGNRKYFTMGVGVKYNVFGLNFAYLLPSGNGVNRNPLSNTLRFSLIFDLSGAGETKE
jgi:Type IX secretion system protein PorV